MPKKESPEPASLVDVMNGSTAIFITIVGVLLLQDGLTDRELPFLLFGLLLAAVGTFQITFRVIKGEWFRMFGKRNPDDQ